MISLPALLLLIVVAAVCGAVGRAIAGGTRGGILVSIVVGFIGAFLGSWLAHRLKLPEPLLLHISGPSFPLLGSIVGAALFVAIIHLISGRRRPGASKRNRAGTISDLPEKVPAL